MEEASIPIKEEKKDLYNRLYKPMLFVSLLILLLSIGYLVYFYQSHGDIIYKDSSLSGGTTITLNQDIDPADLKEALAKDFQDVIIREIKEISTGKRIAVIIDSSAQPDQLQESIEKFLGHELEAEDLSVEFTGPSLSANFYRQLIISIIISFILISIVVFFLFRKVFRSLAILLSVLGNIVMPLALANLLGIRISAAGIAAFLMLIGYSVDSDILLTTRVLKKKEGTVNQRILGAFKTGIFITGTALVGLLPAFFIVTGIPDSFRQIFLILAFGLVADLVNTWGMNASILKWYTEVKKI